MAKKKRIAINGFGRIGRLTFRALLKDKTVQVVAINDLTGNNTLAHLLKYDTMQGPFEGTVEATETHLIINKKKILCTSIPNPADLPWKKNRVDVVLECTGRFLDRKKAQLHINAGAKKVVLSAPAKSSDIPTIVIGANHKKLKAKDTIVSNASCTTNCLTPMVMILDKYFGITNAFMTTIHAYTAAQNIQDGPHKDLRRARAAAQNILPTSTGAAKAVTLVVPHLKGKLEAQSVRVPTATGSLTDFVVNLKKKATVKEINAAFLAESKKQWKGVVQYQTDPIVSSDIVRSPYSCIFDSLTTQVNGKSCRIVGWYDNEAGYSARLAELAAMM